MDCLYAIGKKCEETYQKLSSKFRLLKESFFIAFLGSMVILITTPMTDKNNNDNISKQLLIAYLIKKLEDNPICNINQFIREWSKGYRKGFKELLGLLKD